jgi:hypothetical protein
LLEVKELHRTYNQVSSKAKHKCAI